MIVSKKFIYGNYSYCYKIVQQDRKSLSLVVRPDSSIVLKQPFNIKPERVEKFLKKKWFWLNKQLSFFESIEKHSYKKEYVSGESFSYLGRQYKLLVKKSKIDSVKLTHGTLVVNNSKGIKNSNNTKNLLNEWFEKRYKIIFLERYEEMKKLFDYKEFPELKIRIMSKRWGSFVNNKSIVLNPKLIYASKKCIDYVLVHELCHVKYKNHNKKYWEFLKMKYPDWEVVKEKLEYKYGLY